MPELTFVTGHAAQMEEAGSFETSVSAYKIAWCHNVKGYSHNNHRHENVKTYTSK
jgi:hypothetical protein